MFWSFLELDGDLVYCPLADFGAKKVRRGQDIYAHAIVGQPVTAHRPLYNVTELKGTIAVVQRGLCNFITKVWHAQQAGAVAVLVANNIDEGNGEAFVMDAGHSHKDFESKVTIPAIMVSRNHSIKMFELIREAYLDRTHLSITIRFLSAETTSRVLLQQEQQMQQSRDAKQHLMCKQQREQQQQEAITLLRNRLGTLTIQNSGSLFSENEVSSCTSESSSISSISTCAAHCNSICENGHDSSQTWNHENEENEFTANSLVMQPWSPMTTAVLVLDVQNYFVLPQGYGRTRQDTRTEYFPRVKDFYDRVDNVLLPTLQDVLLASRSVGGMEVFYSIVENATHDGRERSLAHKHAGIHVPKHGFGAQVPFQIAPQDSDMVLPRTGINVFTATNLDYILRNLMVTHVVVMGLSVLNSIEACVQSAVDRGYQVTVIKEALFLFEKSMKEDSIMVESMAQQGVQVQSAAEFVEKVQSFI